MFALLLIFIYRLNCTRNVGNLFGRFNDRGGTSYIGMSSFVVSLKGVFTKRSRSTRVVEGVGSVGMLSLRSYATDMGRQFGGGIGGLGLGKCSRLVHMGSRNRGIHILVGAGGRAVHRLLFMYAKGRSYALMRVGKGFAGRSVSGLMGRRAKGGRKRH